MTPRFLKAFDALPAGTFKATYQDRPYIVTKSALSEGKAQKLVAEELGGTDYISLNLYRLASGPLLKPCEMPDAKVIAFVEGVQPLA
ncbi:hypothetical protein [uncultured Litoreibacter sp.]|uniref:hypothetical protein n=1 Tax=uncultured Litoreibacter sp. TaxID=1392394 RepID=UPI002636C7C7|nr:hypothetical protein [uncultured Litoreibacter sp.]